MLPLTEILGPAGPDVATRQGQPSSQALLISVLMVSESGMGMSLRFRPNTLAPSDPGRDSRRDSDVSCRHPRVMIIAKLALGEFDDVRSDIASATEGMRAPA